MGEHDDLDVTLAAQHLQLEAARERVAELRRAIEGGEDAGDLPPLIVPEPADYAALTAASRRYLESAGRADIFLEDVLAAEDLELLRVDAQRLDWTTSDVAAVGLCALAGSAAAVLAGAIDAWVVDALDLMEGSELVARWKQATEHLPIDYHGAVVGGPRHRMTSAGHDIGRPVAAIRQIVNGVYEGTGWVFGEKVTRTAYGTTGGTPFDAVPDFRVAAALWVKHLITDLVTPTSLPLPGWTLLYERAPIEAIAEFLKDLYWTNGDGPGWNLRTVGLTKTIPLVVVEFGIRSKVGWDAWATNGSLRLSERERNKLDEMLLAANGVVAAVTTGQAALECFATQSPLGLRSLNPQALMRTAHLGVRVVRARREMQAQAPAAWAELTRLGVADADGRLGQYTI